MMEERFPMKTPNAIYYDENLFYLNEIINTIATGLRLNLQASIFAEKLVEDILFVENALSHLFGALVENTVLINRSEHLRRLLRTRRRFAEVLNSIMAEDHSLSVKLEPFFAKFRDLADGQRDHIRSIRETLSATQSESVHEKDVVSELEFKFLLSEESSEEI